jgi:histone acetyltransferase MYST1
MRNLQEKDAKEKEKQRRATAKNTTANAKGDSAIATEDGATGAPRSTRAQKRKAPTDDHEFAPPDEHDEHEGMDAASIREHEEVTKVKVRGARCMSYMSCWRMLTL